MTPPEPRLSVFPNNTLELFFTKPLSRLVEVTDIAIQVFDGYMVYMPNWNMNALAEMTSYLIDSRVLLCLWNIVVFYCCSTTLRHCRIGKAELSPNLT